MPRGLRPRTLFIIWGLRPHTPGYFSLAGKVPKRAHREGTLSMGSLPYEPHPRDDTKGACPLWNPPCIVGSPAKNGPAGAAPRQTSAAFAEEEGGAAQRAKPAACGRMRDAELVPTRAPFVSSRKRGGTGEKPHRKGFSSRAPFCLLFRRGKSRPGSGGGAPEKLRKETCFSPTRPAIRESQRIGAIRWHRRSETGVGPKAPFNGVWGLRPRKF